MKLPKRSVLKSVKLINNAALSSSNVDFIRCLLKANGVQIGALDTRDTALVQREPAEFDLSQTDLVAGSNLSLSIDENEGLPEITKIACVAASGLDAKSFLIHDAAGSVGVWFDATGSTTIPAGAALADRAIEVTLTGSEDAEEVATALAAALDGDAAFSAIVDPEDPTAVLVTDAAVGTRTDATDAAGGEATGFTITVEQQGAAAGSVQLTQAKLAIEYFVP
jgi:hypothetical protein